MFNYFGYHIIITEFVSLDIPFSLPCAKKLNLVNNTCRFTVEQYQPNKTLENGSYFQPSNNSKLRKKIFIERGMKTPVRVFWVYLYVRVYFWVQLCVCMCFYMYVCLSFYLSICVSVFLCVFIACFCMCISRYVCVAFSSVYLFCVCVCVCVLTLFLLDVVTFHVFNVSLLIVYKF